MDRVLSSKLSFHLVNAVDAEAGGGLAQVGKSTWCRYTV